VLAPGDEKKKNGARRRTAKLRASLEKTEDAAKRARERGEAGANRPKKRESCALSQATTKKTSTTGLPPPSPFVFVLRSSGNNNNAALKKKRRKKKGKTIGDL
jgi:hypothetical protein